MLLGGVVYEDPWLAGGHNGLSNSEDPKKPEDPYPRVAALRRLMREYGLGETPIIMAGGVWWLSEWEHWLDNPEIGPIAFQFGTRPLLTKESPIATHGRKACFTLKEGDVFLNRFSPTGFYSSAVNNRFIQELRERTERQVAYTAEPSASISRSSASARASAGLSDAGRLGSALVKGGAGLHRALRTPDSTLIFVTPEKAQEILADQVACMGCLSRAASPTGRSTRPDHTTGKRADPRSFCIQKTLQNIAHDADRPGTLNDNLMFSGHNAYRFAKDPFYSNGFIPTVKQLVERILTGR